MEQFLEERYDSINSNSNNMNEAFERARDSWFEGLDVSELIEYGDLYGRQCAVEAKEELLAELKLKGIL